MQKSFIFSPKHVWTPSSDYTFELARLRWRVKFSVVVQNFSGILGVTMQNNCSFFLFSLSKNLKVIFQLLSRLHFIYQRHNLDKTHYCISRLLYLPYPEAINNILSPFLAPCPVFSMTPWQRGSRAELCRRERMFDGRARAECFMAGI